MTSQGRAEKSRRKSSCRKRPRKEGSKRQRKTFSCPIPCCKGEVVYLFRHIIQVHKDIPRHEIALLLKKKKSKRTLHFWRCSEGCNWKGDRLDKHLASKSHGFEKSQAKTKANEIKRQQPPTVVRMRNRSADSFVNCDMLSEEFHEFLFHRRRKFCPRFLGRLQENPKSRSKQESCTHGQKCAFLCIWR